MQLLILAHALDEGAQGVANILAPVLRERLTVLRPEWLGQARWSHRLSAKGVARTRLRWHDGRHLDPGEVGLMWNRIRLLPQAAFRNSAARDRDYAGAELEALVASWLAEFGDRVVPPMRRHACVAPVLHHLHWTAIARRCGLSPAPRPGAPELFSVLRTPTELCGPLAHAWPVTFRRACHAVGSELGFSLLSLGFQGTPEAPLLCRVDAHPALTSPGEAAAVARWLCERADVTANGCPRAMQAETT